MLPGEGGPVKITRTDNFNVIHQGAILLIRESKCERPNIAIHEFLHALGFDHSTNPNNIMYGFVRCEQTVGEDISRTINEIYSVPPQPDLTFGNISAIVHGVYLDINMTVKNNGLKRSENTTIKIQSEEDIIKKIDLQGIDIGHGLTFKLDNILVAKLNVEEIKFTIDSEFDELNKKNNKRILKRNKRKIN